MIADGFSHKDLNYTPQNESICNFMNTSLLNSLSTLDVFMWVMFYLKIAWSFIFKYQYYVVHETN